MEPDRVLVLGAGVAGLAAAQRLIAAGQPVTVLEARDQIGGRIRTDRSSAAAPIEAGPEFLHGQAPELDDLLRSAEARVETVPSHHWHFAEGRLQETAFGAGWESILQELGRLEGPDLSFKQLLDARCSQLTPIERAMSIDYVEGFNAANQDQISSLWLRKSELELGAAEDEIRRVTSGYSAILDVLLARSPGLDLRLRTSGQRLRWERGAVAAEAIGPDGQRETFIGSRAVVTLPLGILQIPSGQERGIEFVPDLPAKRAAASAMVMGEVVKVVFVFREPFWKSFLGDDGGFVHAPGRRFLTWWPFGHERKLTGWSGGPRARELSDLDDEALTAAAVADLAAALGIAEGAIRGQLAQTHIFNWPRDPWTRGAYSYARVGGAGAIQALAAPVGATLFFAGEATDETFPATVAGALRSGYRAADELLTSLASPEDESRAG